MTAPARVRVSPSSPGASKKTGLVSLRRLLTPVILLLFLLPIELLIKFGKADGPARKDTIPGDFMLIRLRPDFQGSLGNMQSVFTNRYGFRGQPDFPQARPREELRVLSLGDSVGFGFGVGAEETFCRQAESLLNRGKRVRLINAAGQGYSPSSYLAYLLAEGFDFEPNLILVQMEPSNDVTDEALLRVVTGKDLAAEVRGGRYGVAWDGNLLGSITLGPYFYERIYLYTMLTRRLFTTLDQLFPQHSALSAPGSFYYHQGFDRFLFTAGRIEQGWERSLDALTRIGENAGRNGSQFVLLLTPTRFAFHENEEVRGFGNGLVDRMVEWAGARGIAFIDLRPAVAAAGGSALYLDFAHLTAQGHRAAGREIARQLAPYLP